MAPSPPKTADAEHRRHPSISRTLSKLKSSRRDDDLTGLQDGVGAAIRRGDVAISGPIPIAEEEHEDESSPPRNLAAGIPKGRSFPSSQIDLNSESAIQDTLVFTPSLESTKPRKLTRRSSENLLQLSTVGFPRVETKVERRKSQGALLDNIAVRDFPKPRKPTKFKAIVTKIFGTSPPSQGKVLTLSSQSSLKSQPSLTDHGQLSPTSTGPERLHIPATTTSPTSTSPITPHYPASVAALEWPETVLPSLSSTREEEEDAPDTIARRIRRRHESMLATLPTLNLHKPYSTFSARPYSALHRSITVGSTLDHPHVPEYDLKQRSKSISTTSRMPARSYSEGIKRHRSDDGLNWRQSKFVEEFSPMKGQQNLSNPDFTSLQPRPSLERQSRHSTRTASAKHVDTTQLEARVEYLERRMVELEKALEQSRSRTNSVRGLSSPSSLRSPSELHERTNLARDGGLAHTPTRQEYHYLPLSGQLAQSQLDASQSCAIDQQSESSHHDNSPRDRRYRSLSTSTTIRVQQAQRRGSEPEHQETISLTGLQYTSLINMIRDEQSQRKKLEAQVLLLLKQLEYRSPSQDLPTPVTATMPPLGAESKETHHSPILSPQPIRRDLFSHFDSHSRQERSSFATDDEGGLGESGFETSSTEQGFCDDVDGDDDEDDEDDDEGESFDDAVANLDSPARTMSLSRLTIGRPITTVAF